MFKLYRLRHLIKAVHGILLPWIGAKQRLTPLPSHVLSPLISPLNVRVLVHLTTSSYTQFLPSKPKLTKYFFIFLLVPRRMKTVWMSLFSLIFNIHPSSKFLFPWPFKAHTFKYCFSLMFKLLNNVFLLPAPFRSSPSHPHYTCHLQSFHFCFSCHSLLFLSWIFFSIALPFRTVVFKFKVHQDDLEGELKHRVLGLTLRFSD